MKESVQGYGGKLKSQEIKWRSFIFKVVSIVVYNKKRIIAMLVELLSHGKIS